MAARRFKRRFSVRAKGDIICVTTVIQASIAEGGPTLVGTVISPVDWSNNAGFDRGTLMGISGTLSVTQEAVATAAEATALFLGLYRFDPTVTTIPNPGAASSFQDFDCLQAWAWALSVSTASIPNNPIDLRIKNKRRISTADTVQLIATMNADAGTPRCNIAAITRAYIKTE